jgi:azurin
VVELEIATVGDTMYFDKKALTVPAGSTVHLKLKNNGTLEVMQHNWVLVTPGKEAAVAAEGLAKAQKTGYLVPGPDVLANTPMAKPGQTVEVTFPAPAAGKYAFICTYPGHYLSMHGSFTVTP